ncbi:diguanylate phosphodiesterase [Burkholderia ubonensis]|uniref:EAL domain-containing protein n=1 Tax=Burkholderia ubonensis TaxID=101571 RepID=UPI000751BF55|nr:EAL domain-containing protein [Burkholderia ubonensis]KVU44452.1 diguanylate phosphodiesterase [Burkholderia ubonensis]
MSAFEGCHNANTTVHRDDTAPMFDAAGNRPDLASVCNFIESRLAFAHEPVCKTDLSGDVLYHECLARLVYGQHVPLRPAAFLPHLVSMGLMCWFDQLVVRKTIERLRRDPDAIYGCNVAASSAMDDARWQAVLDSLEREPSIETRLVIEITETVPLSPVFGRSFVSRIRQTGCRIAIDDFGVGYSALNNLVVGNPDIVKMDKSILPMLKSNAVGRYQLRRFVALARENAQQVVVEGVESELDRQVIVDVGVSWAQGYRWHCHVAEGIS